MKLTTKTVQSEEAVGLPSLTKTTDITPTARNDLQVISNIMNLSKGSINVAASIQQKSEQFFQPTTLLQLLQNATSTQHIA